MGNDLPVKAADHLRVATWNVNWASGAGWESRRAFLHSLDADIICLQEVAGDLAARLRPYAAWAETSRPFVKDRWRKRNSLVVGVAGTSTLCGEVSALDDTDFPEVPDWLAARFAARTLAVDVEWNGACLRVGSFHATPAASSGVGQLKPWFHTRVGQWVATWPGPWLFGIDANSHAGDHEDLEKVRWCWPAVRGGPGEDRLLGVLAPHRGEDALRRHFATAGWPAIGGQRVWRASKYLADGPVRYDHLVVSPGLQVALCEYVWAPKGVSDHAAVVADLRWTAAGEDPPLARRPWTAGTPLATSDALSVAPRAALKVRQQQQLDADDRAWEQHSGGAGHDRPGWALADLEDAKRVVARLNAVARRALEVLVAEPGRQRSSHELVEECRARSVRALAASLGTFADLGSLNRRLPLRWWKRPSGGSLYAVHPDDAPVFAAALECRPIPPDVRM